MPAEAGRKTKCRALWDNAKKVTLTPNSAWMARTGRQNFLAGAQFPPPRRAFSRTSLGVGQRRRFATLCWLRSPALGLVPTVEFCAQSVACKAASQRHFARFLRLWGAASSPEREEPSQPTVNIAPKSRLSRPSKTVEHRVCYQHFSLSCEHENPQL